MRFLNKIFREVVKVKTAAAFRYLLQVNSILLLIIFYTSNVTGQAVGDYRTNATGTWNWTTAANWQRCVTAGTWTGATSTSYPGQNPGAGTVTIRDNSIVTLNVTPLYSIGALDIPTGGNDSYLNFNGTNSLTVTGATTLYSNSNNDEKAIRVDAGTFITGSFSASSGNDDRRDAYIRISSGNVYVNGDLNLNNTGLRTYILFTGNGSLFVGGNMSGGGITSTTDGGAAPTSGTVNYNNNGDQNVGPYTYNNLTLSGGGTKTIQGGVTVNNILNLGNGNLSLGSGANDLTIGNAGSITGTFDNTHMIVCDGTGTLIRQGDGNADYNMIYPLGTGTQYTPVQISNFTASVATGNITMRAVSGSAPGPPPVNSTDLQKYWEISQAGLTITNADLSFTYVDPAEVGTGGDQSSYTLNLYGGGVWSVPTNVSVGGVNPMTVTGRTNINGIWIGREGPKTYYSYQSGTWGTANTWTTDPSGTLSVSPGVPSVGDRAIILNGRTVTTTTGYTVLSVQINEGGTLDIGNTTGHDFGDVRGKGLLRLNTNTFPTGSFTDFVAANGGTVEYYNLNNTRISNTQLTYNNLIVSNSSAGASYTCYFDNSSNPINYTINGDFTLKNSSTGTLTVFLGNPTASSNLINLTVYGNVTVNTGCNISVNNFASEVTYPNPNSGGVPADFPVHKLYLHGNLINNGSIRFTGLPTAWDNAYYTLGSNRYGGTNYGQAQVTFRGSANNSVVCNGTTDFFRFIVEKGIDQTYILDVTSANVNNFKLYGSNNQGQNVFDGGPEGYGYGAYSKALFVRYGTLKLNDNISVPSITEGGQDFNLISTACLWVNGATVSTTAVGINGTGYQAATLYGRIRVSAGSFSTGDAAGIVLGSSATPEIIVEGTGNFSASQVWSSGTGNKISYIQTGGTTDIRGGGEFHAGNMLGLSNPNTVFTMTGGTLNFTAVIDGSQGMDIRAAAGNYTVTGGTVNINLPGGTTFDINTTVPFYNLNVSRASGAGNVTARFLNTSSTSVSVLNDLVLNANTILDAGTNTVSLNIGHDFTMDAASTYTCGTNTTTFNGAGGQRFSNAGSVNGGTGLNNLVISNTSNTDILSNNLIVRGNLTISENCFLNDVGRTISVAGNIVNSGTHSSQAGGAIILNNTVAQTIGGSGNGIFGNLIINKTAGLASFTANHALTGNLRLANGLLDINTYKLSLGAGSNIYDALTGTTAVFSGTKMIRTAGNMSDGGVSKGYNATTAFVFPIGTANDYTPATIQFNSIPATWGTVNIKPVTQFNPFVTSTNSLNYYWKVTQTGFTGIPANSVSHTYRYIDADLVGRGTEGNYIPGVYNPFAWAYINDVSQVVDATNDIRFNNVSYVDGDFTAGELNAFNTVNVFYSRANGTWNDPNTWSTIAVGGAACPPGAVAGVNFPGPSNPVVIGDGALLDHIVTVGGNGVIIGGLQINTGSTLDIGSTTGHNFGSIPDSKITGTGLLRISSSGATATFPGGDFGNFLTAGGGTVEYYSIGAPDFTIPTTKTYYNNLVLSPATGRFIAMPNIDLTVFGDYTISGVTTGVARLNAAAARTLTVQGNINVTSGILQYYNGTAQTIYANGDINISGGATFNVRNGGTAVTNLLYITGSLNNNGAFDMFTSATLLANVYFRGATNKVISGSGTNDFNILYVDKGTSRNTILDVTAGNLTLSYTGGAALVLNNGTFRVSNTGLNFTLSTTTPFSIPATAALSVSQGTVNVGTNNNNGDLILAGRLEVMNTGVVNIGNSSGTNNDIEYAPAGNPEIIVQGGTLTVDGQIRRLINNTLGSLTYTQSGGTVLVKGLNQPIPNTRGKFEVLNAGSQFNMSLTGTLIIQNGGGDAAYFGDVLIIPETSDVIGGTIQIGNGSTASTGFLLNSSAPLWNLIVDGITTSKTVDLRINPVTIKHDLTINGNSSFRANGINVNIGGSLINNNSNAGTGIAAGGYQAGSLTQLTTFNGAGSQSITGSGSNLTNFANLVAAGNSVTLSPNSNIRVNANLTLSSGTLNDGSNNITVIGNIDNAAIHNSPTTSGGIIMTGIQQQIISGNGNGVFGNVTLINALGIDMVDNSVINGRLTFSNGNLYIDDYKLTFGINATIGGAPDENMMILMNGVISDQGVEKLYPASAADFTFPIGVAGKYTPARFNVTANSALGSILIRPINYKHPSTFENPAATNELQYYWNVVSSGFSGLTLNHEYRYSNADAEPDETNYVVGRYTTATYSWSAPTEGAVNAGSDNFVLNNVNFIDGEYTCGVNILPSPNFQNIPVYYSRNTTSGGNWTDPNAWTLNADGSGGPAPSYPQGNATVILAGHTITLNTDGQVAYATEIHGTLNVGITLYHSLGHIRGDGTIRITSTASGSFILPAGEYDDFMGNSSSTIDFYNNSAVAATLPLKPGNDYKPFQNVIFSGNGVKYMSAENMRILGNLTIDTGTGTLNNTLHNRSLTILGNWTDNNTSATGGFVPGTGNVIFNGTGAQQLNVAGATSTEQFYNLQINNASGMTISGLGKATVSNNLYLTLGNITTTNANLLSVSNTSTSAVVGGGSSSFVNGPLQKSINSGSYFNFPIGNNNGTKYGNLYVSGVSATGNYIAQYYNHNPGTDGYNPTSLVAPLDAVSNVEYWRINGLAATANLLVRWDAQSGIIPADASSRTKLRIAEWNGTAWQNRGNIINDGGQTSGTIQTSPVVSVNGNHYFTIGVESLPTVDITSGNTSFCNDGVATATITVTLTGTAPWTIRYRVNGANETTINNIASSPFNIVIGSTSPGITGAGSYVYNMSYISDATGATGIRDFTETVTVQVNAAPNPVITGLTTLPLSTNTNYSVTNVIGNTYTWATSGVINSGGSTYQANVRFNSGTSGWVRVTETMPNGCSVTTANYNITITDIPSPLVSGNASVCVNGATETYSTPNVPTHTYSWTLPSGGGTFVGATNSATVQVNWTTTGTHTISVSEGGSSTVIDDLSVTVNPQPSIILAVSDPSICLGETANVIITAGEAGSDYTLRLNSDNSVITTVHTAAAGNVTLPVTPASSGSIIYNIYVTNEYSCSRQLTDLSTITINPLPVTGPMYRQPNN